jgi:hypothetical protein
MCAISATSQEFKPTEKLYLFIIISEKHSEKQDRKNSLFNKVPEHAQEMLLSFTWGMLLKNAESCSNS